jgi:hypothetical protein
MATRIILKLERVQMTNFVFEGMKLQVNVVFLKVFLGLSKHFNIGRLID